VLAFNVDEFVERVLNLQFEHHFNPYTDVCSQHDLTGAHQLRRENLRAYLHALQFIPIETAWIGRDLGYRGGRRTGLPLTDEENLPLFQTTYKTAPLKKATQTATVKELTAKEIWRILPKYSPPPLLWNVVPLHPHKSDNPMSNRSYSPAAAQQSVQLLNILLMHFKPKTILALGRGAHEELARLKIASVYVRHPSHAGQAAFRAGLQKHMSK